MYFSKFILTFICLASCICLNAHDTQLLTSHIHSEAKPFVEQYTNNVAFIQKGLITTEIEAAATTSLVHTTSAIPTTKNHHRNQCVNGFMYIFALLGVFLSLGYWAGSTSYQDESS